MYLVKKRIIYKSINELRKEIAYIQKTDRPKRVFFDHIPKCGGSSLKHYLESNYLRRKTKSFYHTDPRSALNDFKNTADSKRHSCQLIIGHYLNTIIDHIHPESIKVTVLREPIDRIISHYYYVKRSPSHYLFEKVTKGKLSISEYVESDLSHELVNFYTTYFSGIPNEDAMLNPEESVDLAIRNISKNYDIIGYLDDFSLLTDSLYEQLKLKYKYKGEVINHSIKRKSTGEIDDSTRASIQQANRLDVDFYNKLRSLTKEK